MTEDEMKHTLQEISSRLDVIYKAEKHWATRWKKGDKGMIFYPPANSAMISNLERRLKQKLPPSYRQFLTITDGCDHFWIDFSFLGSTGEHSERVMTKISEYAEWQKTKIKDKFGALTEETITKWETANARNMYLERNLPIATTFGGDVYVFDAHTRNSEGEMGVVFWDLSWGAWDDRRDPNFDAFLRRTLGDVHERAKKYKSRSATKSGRSAQVRKKNSGR